jgi:cytochrome P450
MLPKSSPQAQTLTYRNQAISIPANSSVSLDIVAVQRNPRYWGSDPHDFRPSRWLMVRIFQAFSSFIKSSEPILTRR